MDYAHMSKLQDMMMLQTLLDQADTNLYTKTSIYDLLHDIDIHCKMQANLYGTTLF